MSGIWSVMDVGKRSLMNSQSALQTVSHNVSNKGTKGYSRQRVELETAPPTGHGKLRIGTGARASQVTRINNPYLEKQLENEGANLGLAQGRQESLARVEQVFNEQANKGLNKFMGEFFNAFRELSNNPESLATRTLVKEAGQSLSKDFHRVHRQLTDIQADIDFQVVSHIEEINQLTKEIASLNEKVQAVELQGIPANDERDRRDQLLKDLGELIDIKYTENKAGDVTVTAGETAILVSGQSHMELAAKRTEGREGKREGNFDIFYKHAKNGSPINITEQVDGGRLGGLLETRDQTVNKLLGRMDHMAYKLAEEVNKAHTQGYDRYDQKAVSFFELPTGEADAAASIKVNDAILQDVGRVATAAKPGSPGDNRIANIISAIQHKTIMGGENATVDDYYGTTVGEVGIQVNRANSYTESQKDIVKQLRNIRESISGVSLDEETTKMIEFQKAFDASARLIRTADEMMETVLRLKRM